MQVLLLIAVLMLGSTTAIHRQPDDQRARDLAAALNKTKSKHKEKKGITIDVYVAVTNDVADRSDPTAFSGRYEDSGYRLDLAVAANGTATGKGYDDPSYDELKPIPFELQNGRVDGALLTGTKVYANGESRKFEAVFVNRKVELGSSPQNVETIDRSFGLGFLEGSPEIAGSEARFDNGGVNRVFLTRR